MRNKAYGALKGFRSAKYLILMTEPLKRWIIRMNRQIDSHLCSNRYNLVLKGR